MNLNLQRNPSKSTVQLLRFTTCGSVDDGKSTLIGRLLFDSKAILEDQFQALKRAKLMLGDSEVNLANLTDGLRAEREQGITIDVAYRYFSTPKRKFIVADTPGHVQYTRNMVTGASTANLALILVDARKGVSEQTRRHSAIASLLGIPHLALCINKMDLVNFSRDIYENICQEFSAFHKKLEIKNVASIPMSALLGDNVVDNSKNMNWYKGQTLLSFLESVKISSNLNLDKPRFPVQWIIRPDCGSHNELRGFAGQIASGTFQIGDPIIALPSGRQSRIKNILMNNDYLKLAFAPMSISLVLEDEIDIGRGEIIVPKENMPHLSKEVEAMVCWMNETPLKIGRKYILKHTSRTTKTVIKDIKYRINIDSLKENQTQTLKLNEIGKVVLRTASPLIYDCYQDNRSLGSLIIIDEVTHETVGAGMLIDPQNSSLPPETSDYSI